MNGTTQGVSAVVELTGLSDNRWKFEADVRASGTIATQFSQNPN